VAIPCEVLSRDPHDVARRTVRILQRSGARTPV